MSRLVLHPHARLENTIGDRRRYDLEGRRAAQHRPGTINTRVQIGAGHIQLGGIVPEHGQHRGIGADQMMFGETVLCAQPAGTVGDFCGGFGI